MKSPAPIGFLFLLTLLSLLAALVSGSSLLKDRFALVAFGCGATAVVLAGVQIASFDPEDDEVGQIGAIDKESETLK